MKFKRFFLNSIALFTVIVIAFSMSCVSFAVSDNMTTYSDTLYSNSTVSNLLSLRQEEQLNKKYIGFRSSDSEYVLILSDNFTVNGNKVTAENCDLIVYSSNMGSSNATRYYSISSDTVSVTINHVVTSNFLEGSSKNESSSYQRYMIIGLFCLLGVVLFWVLRRFK